MDRYFEALISGQSRKIEKIYQDFYPRIEDYIKGNSGTRDDAQDIFQKALVQIAVRHRNEPFEIQGDFKNYLFVVCQNLWRRHLKTSKTTIRVDNEYFSRMSTSEDESRALTEQKRFELFIEKLGVLSSNCSRVLELYFSKIAYSEIVTEMGYSTETVARQRVFKCKNQLIRLILSDSRYNQLK